MKTAARLLPAFLFIAGVAAAQPNDAGAPLTLDQAIQTVLARYPTLDAAQAAVDAARARAEQAASARFPQVSAGGSYTYVTSTPGIPFGGTVFYTTLHNIYTTSVNLQQLLTDFGHTGDLIAMARSGRISAEDALDEARHQLGYETIQVFYSVLLLRQSVAVSDTDIHALDEALRISDRKYVGGTATKFDVLTTQVQLADAHNRRSDTIDRLTKQEALLRQLLGDAPDAALNVQGDFPSVSSLPTLSDCIAVGLENRPEMHEARDAARTADLRLRAARSENRPTLAANAQGGMENNQLPNLYADKGFGAGGVSLSVPLFTGGRIRGDEDEARAGQRQAQDQILDLDRSIATDVADDFADLTAAAARLNNADLQVQQADEALQLARTRYANGVITNFELLDAESADRSAQLSRVQAHYDWALARQALSEAMGEAPRP